MRYRISENAAGGGTVAQVWQYGKNRGEELFSPIVSDVDHLPASNTYLMTSGSLGFDVDYVSARATSSSGTRPSPNGRESPKSMPMAICCSKCAVLADVPGTIVYRAESFRSTQLHERHASRH